MLFTARTSTNALISSRSRHGVLNATLRLIGVIIALGFCGPGRSVSAAEPDRNAADTAEGPRRPNGALSSFTVAGRSVGELVIVRDEANRAAAEVLHGAIQDCAGLELKIVSAPVTTPAIEFSAERPVQPNRFEMVVSHGNLVLRTDVEQGFLRGIRCFFANEVRAAAGGALTMAEGFKYSRELTDVVHYSEFGTRGDGETDDIEAIAEAHEFANEHGLPVKADDGATYYIGGKDKTAVIQTDTDFGSARFIVDDRNVENRRTNIFVVRSEQASFKLEGVSSLKRNQEKIDVSLPSSCIVTVTDSNTKRYIRYGANQNKGSSQTDVFIVDHNGNVDMSAPIVWDFDQITDITAQPMDMTPLTISGGHFTTIANAAESKYTYYGRGIAIRRSHVVVDGLEHHVTGEGDTGAPYSGFINISRCANVRVQNTILTGHKTYRTIGSAGRPVSMGTYDISLNRALNVSFVNCSQTNDIKDGRYWGIMGSNFCKNLVLDNCSFSRFDAHQGVANATIRNSTLGHAGINAIGSGTFTVENSTVYGRTLINLRSDYGSTWRGDVVIRNCVFVPARGRPVSASLIGGHYSGQHDFGYTCYMPERITIDTLHIDDTNHPENYNGPAIFSNFNRQYTDESYVEKYPSVKTKEVILRNVTTASGKPLRLSDNPVMFRDVKVISDKDQ